MQHSIAARHAAWPARYVHPGSRARERRLGLRPSSAFIPAAGQRTVLRHPDVGPLAALRAEWRVLTIEPVGERRGGRPAPATRMRWTRSARSGGSRRSSVAPAWPA